MTNIALEATATSSGKRFVRAAAKAADNDNSITRKAFASSSHKNMKLMGMADRRRALPRAVYCCSLRFMRQLNHLPQGFMHHGVDLPTNRLAQASMLLAKY